jgi:ethanolamine phosphate transferase 2 subunit G
MVALLDIIMTFGLPEKSVLIWSILYLMTLFSSSFIEEEQELWYFASAVVTFVLMVHTLAVKDLKRLPSSLLVLLASRIMYAWNRTGTKYIGIHDDVRWFVTSSDSRGLLKVGFVFTSLFCVWKHLSASKRSLNQLLLIVAAGLIALYKLGNDRDFDLFTISSHGLLVIARAVYILIAAASVSGLICNNCNVVATFGILVALVTRLHNLPLLILTVIQAQARSELHVNSILPGILSIHIPYFAFGNSNSFATVDLSSAFVGIDGESIFLAGLLTFLTTFGPLLLAYIVHALKSDCQDGWKHIETWRIATICVLTVSMIFFENHLFLWTVFAPRYIYELVWTIILYPIMIICRPFLLNMQSK